MNMTKKDVSFFIRVIGVLLVITMCVAGLLSLVNMITRDRIAAIEVEKTNAAIKALFIGVSDPKGSDAPVYTSEQDTALEGLYEVKSGDAIVGYYAKVAPKGFKDKVNMLVGLDTEGKVCGIQIISHGETVGIGDKIEDESFRSLFNGKSGVLTYKKGADNSGSLMDGISGATYSSKAVIAGVSSACAAYEAYKGGAV